VAHSGGQAPDINDLVAIAPDGKSVAYVDDYAPPGIIMVSDDNGVMHDPIPIPVPDMPAQEAGVTSVDRGMRWFAGAFAWKRNDAGQWEVAPARLRLVSHSPPIPWKNYSSMRRSAIAPVLRLPTHFACARGSA
jgi:hypothetical protein